MILAAQTAVFELEAMGCRLRFDPGAKQLIVDKPAGGVTSPAALVVLLRRLKELKADVIDLLFCGECGRDVRDKEDRERLEGINPFCTEVGCPFRKPLK